MRSTTLKSILKTATLALAGLLLTAGASFAQQQINLTAGPATATLPDGTAIPMWGYSCGAVVAGSTATCAKSNPLATGWSPVVITIPTTATGGLTINLTNSIGAGVPTSLVIVGQLGGGLGTTATATASPNHDNMGTTWPIASTGPDFIPPTQGARVQSFSTEVAPGATMLLPAWASLRPGTYLIESGTHPSIQGPMGLYGMLVVTTAPVGATAGTAYPGVTYSAEVPLLLSEIDPVQNNAVNTAVNTVGFSETSTIGPFLNGPIASINLTNGGANYTAATTVVFTPTSGGGSGAVATAVVDTDPTSSTFGQITGINLTNPGTYGTAPTISFTGAGTGATATAALQLNTNAIAHCSGGAAACYPPAVNYTPLYYLINGVAFDKTNSATSLFPVAPATGVTGSVLVRFVNAGLRMHVPSIVGSQTGTAAVGGFSLIAEDGNPAPGLPRVQSEVFMAAGKTYDVMINAPAACTPVSPATTCPALPVFDRELSLSGNAIARDAGMLAYIGINGTAVPSAPAFASAVARADTYNSLVAGQTFTVSDPSKGVIANDTNVYGVKLLTAPSNGTVTLNANGTFTYVPSGTGTSDSFVYQANGAAGPTATVTLGAAAIEAASGIAVYNRTYNANTATYLSIKNPGILSNVYDTSGNPNDKDGAGHPLTVAGPTAYTPVLSSGLTLTPDPNGGFDASVTGPGTYTFTYKAQNSQGTVSSSFATVTLNFPQPSNLAVTVQDGKTGTAITDYRWIIEEDRTFYVDPTKTTNTGGTTIVPTFGTNFHTSYMPIVATGCVGTLACESGQSINGNPVVCDIGNGVCRPGTQQTELDPKQVHLDPAKRYYISVLPGDAANPFNAGNGSGCPPSTDPSYDPTQCGHGMGGATIAAGQTAVTILAEPTPFPPSKLSVFVFEDDFPLNGEQDGGGGIPGGGVNTNNEPGLGQFNITLFDDAGGTGDATGQMTYDMFNQPLSNSLAGTIDPLSSQDACPISAHALQGVNDPTQTGITGTIVTCPVFEADGKTPSPLAGQAIVANLMPGRYGVVATPGADHIAKGEEWLQTNTLDGQKAHDSFLRIGEPSFFQEFGPAGYHVSIGFANPKIINDRKAGVCGHTDPTVTGTNCTNTVTGLVTTERMSRTPDERLFSSGDNSSFAFTQCYVSFGDPDGEDFAFTKCDANGNFSLSGLPDGDWRITVFDQWNDMLVDGLSTPVRLAGGATVHFDSAPGGLGAIAINQWQANIYTKSFIDVNGNGIQDVDTTGVACTAPNTPTGCNANYGNPTEPGLTLVPTNIRFRDGSYSNFNNTDLSGNAGFNEEFPLFSWYVVESDSTRFKNTGTHVVYDAGGPSDGSTCNSSTGTVCGNSGIGHFLANTAEQIPVPPALRVPGARYCASADCPAGDTAGGSTGRVDPPWVLTEGWQGFSGQNSFIEFGKKPFLPGETGGIHGEVIYASTRPFDDPGLLIHTSWTPDVPGVTINLYQELTASDGSQTLTLVDSTKTSSWDDWAQGFRSDGNPNMNCPGQGRDTGTNADIFFFTLFNQPMWLDAYNNGGTPVHTIPNNSQYKCYDGMHNWNQVQPAQYDGMYQFPSIVGRNPSTGVPTGGTGSRPGTNCTICVVNVDTTDPTPMLPPGKYVVEVVVPPGYELVKEEDKNILIGDNYIAPVTQEFGGLGSVFILPDQAEVGSAYNANNAQNPTVTLGRSTLPSNEGDTGSVETFWPCVGASRIVPDYISLFPGSFEVAPFAGATRNLCDRKEVTLNEQASALAKFWVFTSAHVAAHFTGVITDDFTSEFDPFSPQFGEKFSPPNLPISIKDWTGTEISRVYTDQWGTYDGLTYSTWEVNPPNPTGYAPTMMVTCMNDPGTGPTPDPLYNPQYSNFCYEIPFMPGQTQYMDTPVVPTSAFAGAGYNNPDCAYPTLTPAIKEVDSSDGVGPWVSAAGHTLTITALGDQTVPNNAYSGPQATTAPFNLKTITRHYGFGNATGTVALVGSNGVSYPLTSVSWSDATITGTVPSGVPNCNVQQQLQYGGSTAQCGELVITAANGKQSIDAVTVTIGGKAPTHVLASNSIQSSIDAAAPGDLLIIDPTCTATNTAGVVSTVACTAAGTAHSNSSHTEILIMWKPVRLQGVGAASSILNANSHPSGKLDVWREKVNCLFGLALNGSPVITTGPASSRNPYDPTGAISCPGNGWNYFNPTANNAQVDRIPFEAVIGWDAELNGNLAEQLQEPSLMGALEGAGITVLAKGVNFPTNPYDRTLLAGFPTGTTLLTTSSCTITTGRGNNRRTVDNPAFPSNFMCNPSSIDGLSVTNSSQGGGGIFIHAWGHNLQIANDRIYNNAGTLSGGINAGQGEFPPAAIKGGTTNAAPYEANGNFCSQTNVPTNAVLPYCFNVNVNVHNNYITANSSTGDELFSATPAGAGGVSFCTGADYYKFDYNWVCGNLSTGDGGGIGHIGSSYNGDIQHNSILFNQSTNPTIPANGGGMIVMGAPDADLVCSTISAVDQDCAAVNAVGGAASVGPSDGIGPRLLINANLIMGNAADAGSGGGIAFQAVNGSDVVSFPTNPDRWNSVTVTNNIITNNVAGWDGAGISLLDSLAVNIINNTIMSNDTTASSGVLFNTFGAPLASASGPTCTSNCGTASAPQPAGVVAIQNSAILTANLPATVNCPTGHLNCKSISTPLLDNDVIFDNRSFYIGVGALGGGTLNQQKIVTLYNSVSNVPAPSQTATGSCPAASYWDLGVRGDTGPTNHAVPAFTLNPTYSVLTSTAGYPGTNNTQVNPAVVSQYCNGSRIPPEFGGTGYQVPPGISDATVPNPIFNLTPAATVDEGNNWVNISWGPLSLTNPAGTTVLGNYAPTAGSSVINRTPSSAGDAFTLAPAVDFFGTLRKTNGAVDAGAVEFVGGTPVAIASVTGGPLTFTGVVVGTTSAPQTLTLHNTGTAALTGINVAVAPPFARPGGNCGVTLAAGGTCTITITFAPTSTTPVTSSATITGSVSVSGSPVQLNGTGVAAVVSATLTPTTHNFGGVTRNCPGTTTLQIMACAGDPLQVFTLTNTGNVTLTGITQGALGGANANEFSVFRVFSTCGPAGGGQLLGQTSLAPGSACIVTVQFKPLTAQTTGAKAATISVGDLAGTQTSTLTGTAN